MAIDIRKVDGRYLVTATPPDVTKPYESEKPLDAETLLKILRENGCHPRDAADAMMQADPELKKAMFGF